MGRYHLVAADFSDVTSLRTKLEESDVDYSCPTLVLAECALVYANADKVRFLIVFRSVYRMDLHRYGTIGTVGIYPRPTLWSRKWPRS